MTPPLLAAASQLLHRALAVAPPSVCAAVGPDGARAWLRLALGPQLSGPAKARERAGQVAAALVHLLLRASPVLGSSPAQKNLKPYKTP